MVVSVGATAEEDDMGIEVTVEVATVRISCKKVPVGGSKAEAAAVSTEATAVCAATL